MFVNSLFFSSSCFAADASASLTISTPSLSATGKAGEVVNVSTDIKVDVQNAETYSLILSVDNPNMTNGNTTLIPGDLTTNNTWGYKWDDASTYTAPTIEGSELTVPTLESNAINFTKTLTFGAKFDSTADAGHYTASGTLSLVATPKALVGLEKATYMQDLSEHPEYCAETPLISGKTYSAEYILTDNRTYQKDASGNNVSNTYTVRKFADGGGGDSGRCWMTQNLRLTGAKLTSADSDTNGNYTIPTSNISSFNTTNTTQAAYYSNATNISASENGKVGVGYYTWCTATAGTCSSATADGANTSYSICPKGWTLPTGGTTGTSDFYKLFKNMGLNNSNSLAASGSTKWGPGDLAIARTAEDASNKVIYNFKYTGRIYNNSLYSGTDIGYWWSSTVYSTDVAYFLYIYSLDFYPGTDVNYLWYSGHAIRCVARNP